MRIIKTILVGMILAAAIIPLPGHTAATQSSPAPETAATAPQTPAPPTVPSEAGPPPAEAPRPVATQVPEASARAQGAPSGREPAPLRVAEGKPIEAVKNGDLKLKLNFQDTPLQSVLEYLSETAGLTIVSNEPIASSRITVISRQAVPVQSAVDLINTVLKEKGLNAVLTGKTLKVVTLANAPKENIPVITVRNLDQIPEGDSVATYLIPVAHITATALVQNLMTMLPDYATLTANAESNALILTDTGSNVRRLMQIVTALDTHMATVTEIRVFRLKNADATTTATLINTIFQQQAQNRGGFGSRGGFPGGSNPLEMMMRMREGMGGPGGQMGGSRGGPRGQIGGPEPLGGGIGGGIGRGIGVGIGVVMSAALGGPMGSQRGGFGSSQGGGSNLNVQVVAAADTQTNSVVVRGPADMLDLVADVIKALDDTGAKVATVRVFQLRYADALNTADVINQLFNQQSSSSSRSRSSRGGSSGFQGGPMMFRGPFGEGGLPGAMDGEGSAGMVGVTAAADSRTNTVVVTGPESVLNVVEEVIKKLDSPLSNVADVKVFHLEYADASNTASLINEVFGQSRTSSSSRSSRSSSQQSQQVMFRGGPGGMGMMGGTGGQTTGASSDISVVASADTRTNSVVVSGPEETLAVIAQIIKELDENPAAERRIFVYALKNANATNLMTILNNLFQELQALNQQVTGSRSTTTGGARNTQRTTAAAGGMAPGAVGGQTAGGTSTTASSADSLSEETYFQADPNTNSLLVMTSSKNYKLVEPIIAELDKPVGQVLIKVLFAELTHSNSVDWGTEFSMLNLRSGGGSTLSNQVFGRPTELALPGSTATSPMGLQIRTLEGDIDLTIHALQQTGRLNVLSRPYVLTRNNQTATITVVEEVPIIGETSQGNATTLTTFEYRDDIGIVLQVTPSVNPEGLVNMTVSPSITTRTGETVQIAENVNPEVFATRSATTQVAVLDGQTIIIGGLIEDQNSETVRKVPLLGDIPIAGQLFRRTIKDKSKTELLIFLTPHVAKEPKDLTGISDAERARSTLNTDSEAAEIYKKHMEAMQNRNAVQDGTQE